MDIPSDHIVAAGPEGLEKVLNEVLEKTKQDPIFALRKHYILYQLGSQKSLITMDTSQTPFKFVHEDSMGRPATVVVKDTIARFVWEKCGEKEKYLKEQTDK